MRANLIRTERSHIPDFFSPVGRALNFLTRLFHLFGTLLSCLFLLKGSRPERFRFFFERAGGAFLKLGQILAMRQDFLPIAYTEELLRLLSSVPESPWEEMVEIFKRELGMSPENFFAEIGRRPIATASIGQVYHARMKDGRDVAVKIARPRIEESFENDFVLAAFIGEVIGLFTFTKAMPVSDVVAEFIASTRAELDFRNEANNAAILLAHREYHPDAIVPRPILEHTSAHVLIMEFLPDVLTAETVLRRLKKDGDAYRMELLEKGIDLEKSSYLFILDILRQYFLDGFFHADPHPGNVFFLPAGKVGFFDLGIVGRAPQKRVVAANIMYSLGHRDVYSTAKYFLDFARDSFAGELDLYRKKGKALDPKYDLVLQKIEEIMVDNFALDLEGILNPWYEAVDTEVHGEIEPELLWRKSASVMLSRIIVMARRYDFALPKEMVLFFRSLSISDMVALRLNPGFDMMKALQMFFHEFPVSRIGEILLEGQSFNKGDDESTAVVEQTFEGLMELRIHDDERFMAAKERLAEIISYYAENYPEIRSLLKG